MPLGNLKQKNNFDGNLIFGVKKFNKKTNRDIHLKKSKKNVLNFFYLNKNNELDPKYSKKKGVLLVNKVF